MPMSYKAGASRSGLPRTFFFATIFFESPQWKTVVENSILIVSSRLFDNVEAGLVWRGEINKNFVRSNTGFTKDTIDF